MLLCKEILTAEESLTAKRERERERGAQTTAPSSLDSLRDPILS